MSKCKAVMDSLRVEKLVVKKIRRKKRAALRIIKK